MARRRDNPEDQAAKGFPGRRRGKTKKQIAALEKQARQDAELLAAAKGETDDLLALPVFIDDKKMAPAIAVWREYAPRLDKLHLLTKLDRYTFSLFCIYAAEFVLANRDVLEHGYTFMVPTIARGNDGNAGSMPRENPAVGRRDFAAKMMMDLAEKFGFTPLDRAKLIRENAMHYDELALFGRARAQQRTAEPTTETEERPGIVGSGRSLDSPPPGKPN